MSRSSDAAPASTSFVRQGEAPAAEATVVVVDDTPDIRLLLRLLIETQEGFRVVGEAEDGAEAVEVVARLRPTLVVLDLAMPKMDGFEVLRRMGTLSPASQVVVVSGFEKSLAAGKALEAGAAAYVEKGSDMHALLRVLIELTRPAGA